MNGKVHAGMMI